MGIEYRHLSAAGDDFLALVSELDRELAEKNGRLQESYASFNGLEGIRDFVVAYVEGEAVGCGSIKAHGESEYEVKRVFVLPAFRGKGVATGLMRELERRAAEKGARVLVLETGADFAPAIRLYEGLGYLRTENYGQYAGMASSVCMRKELH